MRVCSAGAMDLGNFLSGSEKKAIFGCLRGDGLGLGEDLFEDVLRRHATFVHAEIHVGHDLREGKRHLLETSDVVVIIP